MAEQAPAATLDTGSASGDEDVSAAVVAPVEYPLDVVYCEICTMPPEVGIHIT